MPSTTQRLRDKFLVWDVNTESFDDGIDRCRNIIHAYGGLVKRGMISYPDDIDTRLQNEEYNNFWDAVQYLIEEWDYAIE